MTDTARGEGSVRSAGPGSSSGSVRSLVPARLDRLPWARFHWLVVVGLGVSWILDGLEIQIVSQAGYQSALALSNAEVGAVGSVYLAGEVVGALVFGRITDKLGRRKLFILTLGIYLVASGLAGFSWDLWSLLILRFIAGTGIGGEYTAINSAIDELIPSHYRGRVDIAVNGTYWGGAALGAGANLYLLSSHVPSSIGWRIGFFLGPAIGLAIIFLRRTIPESPRWLMTHGRTEEADRTVDEIEQRVQARGITLSPVSPDKALEITSVESVSYLRMAKVFFGEYPSRSILGFTMMVTQAFLYNAIFFTYALVLQHFYGISKANTSYYFFPFALGNLLGPLLIGHLFDTIGRRRMILFTYGTSGLLLLLSAYLFHGGHLDATTQTAFWCVIFFLASAGASSAYLTVSEIFPLELRGQAISFFFALSQGAGGVVAPFLFGHLIGGANNPHPDRTPLSWGYAIGAVIMIIGGLVAWFLGVDAERKSLEDIANPLSAVRGPDGGVTPDQSGSSRAPGQAAAA
jgi:MFS family permease